jgi:hypothetical protein
MGWLFALIKSSALGKLLEFVIKALKNAKADAHVTDSKRNINSAIERLRDKESEAQQRQSPDK